MLEAEEYDVAPARGLAGRGAGEPRLRRSGQPRMHLGDRPPALAPAGRHAVGHLGMLQQEPPLTEGNLKNTCGDKSCTNPQHFVQSQRALKNAEYRAAEGFDPSMVAPVKPESVATKPAVEPVAAKSKAEAHMMRPKKRPMAPSKQERARAHRHSDPAWG